MKIMKNLEIFLIFNELSFFITNITLYHIKKQLKLEENGNFSRFKSNSLQYKFPRFQVFLGLLA